MSVVARKTLVTGWFSFEQMGATAGDLMARDLVCRWLEEAGRGYDVALAPPFEGGVAWNAVEPAAYDLMVFVCGPFGNNHVTGALLERFAHCRKVGVNLTMLQNVDEWNPFDVLLERDSSRAVRPDVTFAVEQEPVPVVGLVLVKPQKEYGERGMHARAKEAFDAVLAEREAATVVIDTRLDHDHSPLRTPAEVETLIARMDLVLTTRLHGMALALKNAVPVVAIDPIRGGAKLSRQAVALGWPYVFAVEALEHHRLLEAFDACLETKARTETWHCRVRAAAAVDEVRARFVAAARGED
jgi:hypothetical protein